MTRVIERKANKRKLLAYLRKKKIGVTLSSLTSVFEDDFGYSSRASAKVSIGKMLEELKNEGKLYCEEINHLRGSIPTKLWYSKKEKEN